VLAAAAFAEHGEYDTLFISNYGQIASCATRSSACPASATSSPSASAATRCASGSIPTSSPAQHHRRRSGGGAARAERAGGGRPGGIGAVAPGADVQMSVRSSGRLTEPSEFENIILKRSTDGALVRVKDVAASSSAARAIREHRAIRRATPSAAACCSCRPPTRCRLYQDVNAEIQRLSVHFPPGSQDRGRLRHHHRRRRVDSRGGDDPARGDRAGRARDFLFLQNWRTTLIPAITIPVSLVGTFAFVKLLGLLDQHADAIGLRWPPAWSWTMPSW